MSESPVPAAAPSPPTWEEAHLPQAQRSLNRFCENWLFAFLVAMSIRHIALEAFRIPTASMEPMLYGDPSFTRSDFVLVDKLWFRVSPMKRWDVTVFQFPAPEIEVGGRDQSAYDADDHRRDNVLTQPLMYRNFVKRALVMPGERFYLANGDLFVGTAGNTFAIARKPPAVQAALWQDIYRHGAQTMPEWYVPWKAATGAQVENLQQQGLRFFTAAGEDGVVRFDQPLRNLYCKPGEVRVEARLNSAGPEIIQAALTAPLFTYHGRIGNIWRLDEWWVSRMTSADLDSQSHGTLLNTSMRERIGDVRLSMTISAVDGTPALRLREGAKHWLELRLSAGGWTLVGAQGDQPEQTLATGQGPPVGRVFDLANIDDQAVLTIDGGEVYRGEVPACNPESDLSELSWTGAGAISVASFVLQRDLHYCNNGFLSPESVRVRMPGRGEEEIGPRERLTQLNNAIGKEATPTDQRNEMAKERRHQRDVRAQMLGLSTEELSQRQEFQRLGYSPETAITAPDNAYLMLGDNSPMSWDGRNWGFVPATNLRGRVVLRARARVIAGIPVPFADWAVVR